MSRKSNLKILVSKYNYSRDNSDVKAKNYKGVFELEMQYSAGLWSLLS